MAPKAYEYVKRILDFGFHNASSVGLGGKLEKQFAERFGQRYGILHANGTATMHTALMAAGIGVGDEVIVPAYTVISTGLVAIHANAVPIIADVDPETWTIDPEDVRRKITPRTKAVIPVSICGLSPDMDPLIGLCKEHGLALIEDNAQCFLGYYKDRVVGSMGDFASFSFQASKHMTCGDGGILICSDEALGTAARKAAVTGFSTLTAEPGQRVVPEELRCHPTFARHTHLGWNYRLPEIAAAVALAELERLDELIDFRREIGRRFDQVVEGCDWLVPQKTPEGYVHAMWTYTVRLAREDIRWEDFRAKFVELGGDGFYGAYRPIHREPIMEKFGDWARTQPDRYPQFAPYMPDYREVTCPVWESIQPHVCQFKTNYFDMADADRQVAILAQTIDWFD